MNSEKIITVPLSSMSQVFADEKPGKREYCNEITVLSNEAGSFQLAFHIDKECTVLPKFELCIESLAGKYITPYIVENVAVSKVGYEFSDEWFLRKQPGLYPDILRRLKKGELIYCARGVWQSVFFNFNEKCEVVSAGKYSVKVTLEDNNCELCEEFTVNVLPAELPEQELWVTNWMHYDCMAYFASCKPFSAKFWKVFKSYITLAVKNGQNMILTPAFTPPLDTAVGEERKTVQLVGVEKTTGGYSFDFSLMEKFISIALECGAERFEHSHMFTQWGAYHAPKIVVRENGKNVKKFGWHTDAHSEEYREFLSAYITAVVEFLKKRGLLERFFFHVSDEPVPENLQSYSKASELMHRLLGDLPCGDALSKVSFYDKGIVRIPIAKTRDIEEFVGRSDNLWLYFTGAECRDYLSNRLIGMPCERHLILALQIYYYDIKGFLHWGFNAHHTTLCESFVNPYASPDNHRHFAGGTSYLVYPETDGATPSVRLIYFREIMQTVRLLKLLENYIGRNAVKSIIDEIIPDFGFKCNAERQQLEKIKKRVYGELSKHIK